MADKKEVIQILRYYLRDIFREDSPTLNSEEGRVVVERFSNMDSGPIGVTHFNQMLHLTHQAGVTDDFFEYYFLSEPPNHPYPVDKVLQPKPGKYEGGISTLKQLDWGLRRLYIDSLLYYGNIRTAFRDLRTKNSSELKSFFESKRYDSEHLRSRNTPLEFKSIPIDDRYLISEMACKAYSLSDEEGISVIEKLLLEEYRKRGEGRVRIGSLFDDSSEISNESPPNQMMLQLGAEEIMDEIVESETELHEKVKPIADKFNKARPAAEYNTKLYLSLINELDVYVATSMRKREDFRSMARDCNDIFGREGLKRFGIRYFDPTMSAAQGHEDKGLIECLMVKCAKVVLYFAGESDSFGKDAEIAMAMSLGKPVIILCPDTEKGKQRETFFRDIHPLSRLIEFETGVPTGAIVTQKRDVAAQLLERIFDNAMEYDLCHENYDGYYRLKERLTGSVVRLQTNSRMLKEAFYNYYHHIP
ncbi:MAG: hypothetical protein OXL41_07405 [Nitrospinae bacterium]|nr:hypothetical protein [Nitrospinota bacterium]